MSKTTKKTTSSKPKEEEIMSEAKETKTKEAKVKVEEIKETKAKTPKEDKKKNNEEDEEAETEQMEESDEEDTTPVFNQKIIQTTKVKLLRADAFDASKLRFDPPKEKIAKKNTAVKYWEIKILYNYGTKSKPDVRQLDVEGPECNSIYGVSEGEDTEETKKTGKKVLTGKYSTSCFFDTNVEKDKALLNMMNEIYAAAVRYMCLVADKLTSLDGVTHDDSEITPNTVKAYLKYPVVYKREGKTIVEGARPYLPASIEFDEGIYKTIFTDDSYPPKEIPKEAIMKSKFKHIPYFSITRIYLGSTKKIAVALKSTIITEIEDASNTTHQAQTLKERREQGSATSSALSAKVNTIMRNIKKNDGSVAQNKNQGTETLNNQKVADQFSAGSQVLSPSPPQQNNIQSSGSQWNPQGTPNVQSGNSQWNQQGTPNMQTGNPQWNQQAGGQQWGQQGGQPWVQQNGFHNGLPAPHNLNLHG